MPSGWATTRERIKRRDGHQCTWVSPRSGRRCWRTQHLEVDHTGDRDDHRDEVLTTLCREHHSQRTQAQAAAARKARAERGRRPPEAHPGQISSSRSAGT